MVNRSSNNNLHKAKAGKNDEFYTQLGDINREINHYREHFKGKVVYCNCDDPRVSNFFHYFSHNFEFLGLKKLITTCYKSQDINLFSQNDCEKAIYLEYDGFRDGENTPKAEDIGIYHLQGDGDFRHDECIELLKGVDIVVTNPPFSLFREYISQLVEYNKKFIVVGGFNAITYKEVFKLIKEDKVWLGYGFKGGNAYFSTTHSTDDFAKGVYDKDTDLVKFRNICWYTNLDIEKRNNELMLCEYYDPEKYAKYDNYDAINIDKIADIPMDYSGAMGVPITFMDKYNPKQFEILGLDDHRVQYPKLAGCNSINGKKIYRRIIIRNKKIQS